MTLVRQAVLAVCVGVIGLAVVSVAAAQPLGVDIVKTGGVSHSVMSANGRYVAWVLQGTGPVFHVRDRVTATTRTYDQIGVLPQYLFAISDDGRYVAFQDGYLGLYAYADRKWVDLETGVVRLLHHWEVFGSAQPRPQGVPGLAMSRDGRTLAWVETRLDTSGRAVAEVMAITPTQPSPFVVGTTCILTGRLSSAWCPTPAVTGDGQRILYAAGASHPEALAYYDVATGARDYYPDVQPNGYDLNKPVPIASDRDGAFVVAPVTGVPASVLFERGPRRVISLPWLASRYRARAVSDGGEMVLLDNVVPYAGGAVLDRHSGLIIEFPDQLLEGLSSDGRFVLGRQLLAGVVTDLRVTDLDADNDGMLDAWERRFGLDPTSAGDAGADPDGDGTTNVAEFETRSHPTAVASATRLFAEGAAGSFFDTTVSVFNPGTSAAEVVVRFVGPTGTAGSQVVHLEPLARGEVASCCVGMLEATEFGIVVESSQPVVADRRMTWDRQSGYGSHASTGVSAPASAWYFAEGATIGGLQTFFLLQNPGATETTASIEYLLANGSSVTRTYQVAAGSRRTVWVNQEGAPLAAAEFAAVVRAATPIVAERAIYRDRPGQTFAAGTNAVGVTAPATRWIFAEGATGPMFDTFVLAANPGDTAVQIQARFDLVTRQGQAATVTRSYDVAPRSRLTIWLDTVDPLLADAEVVTTLDATGLIVAERAMWWPGTADAWLEGHVEFGATEGGWRFAVADGETDDATETETFLLVGAADTDGPLPTLRVTAYPTSGAPITRDVIAAAGRTTIWLRQTFPELRGHVAVVVESVAAPVAVPIVVERAVYSRGFAAGAAARATALPTPP